MYSGFSSRLTTRMEQEIPSLGLPDWILSRRMSEGPCRGRYWKLTPWYRFSRITELVLELHIDPLES